MILGDAAAGFAVDDLFRRAAARRPDAIALVDPPNRASFTDGKPRRLTYQAADRMVSAIAGRLRGMGLSTDAIVGIQLPHTIEAILTLLGVLRAGLIAAPLPLLWRRAEVATALARLGAKAVVTCRRVGDFAQCQFATRIAAEVFSIRYVCSFGAELPDGAVPLDELFTAATLDPVPELNRANSAAAHVAVVTFEIGADGPLPVARRHVELLAGGLGVFLEGRLRQDARIVSTVAPSSFAGICLTLMPWLLSGGTLILHQPFDAKVLASQRRDEACDTLVVPAAVALHLTEKEVAADGATVIAAWPAPDLLAASPGWPYGASVFVDVPIFGEAGFVAARRGSDGRPRALPLGPIIAPRDADPATAVTLAETEIGAVGTLRLRGSVVPGHAFPPGIERTDQPHYRIDADGSVDTGYPCRLDEAKQSLAITGPPEGLACVGFYRFPLGRLAEKISRIDPEARLAAQADPVLGQRLIGHAADVSAMTLALEGFGLNPIVTKAFLDDAAAAATGSAIAAKPRAA